MAGPITLRVTPDAMDDILLGLRSWADDLEQPTADAALNGRRRKARNRVLSLVDDLESQWINSIALGGRECTRARG